MKKLVPVFGILIALALAFPVFASDATNVTASPTLTNPLKSDYNTFSKFAAAVINAAVTIMLPFVVLGFVYSGFLFVKAQGKPKEIEEAQKAITWSVVGAFILFGAYGFAQIISTTISTITTTTTT